MPGRWARRGVELLIDDQVTPVERLQSSGDEAGTAPEDRRFRPDIQGLRAVAVTLVLLFHAHVPGVGGGYVGVDVFFVISGFVITGVLLRERVSTSSTSIPSFYARRVRRIIPAATLVIIVSVIASYAVLGPVNGTQTAGDARWASIFLINVHFASTGTNYLASQLPPSVLQNYWSLAVEEQFYLVYPTIFLAVVTLSLRWSLRHRLAIVLGSAVAISFTISVVQTLNNPTAAYFSPVPRVWELALGGLVAISTTGLRRMPAPIAAALSWSGLCFILLAAVSFSSSTPYPGFAVALPVVGAALVIAGGVAAPSYGVELTLRLKPCQWLGLISYSLYLWHWPLLTIAAEHSASGTLSVWRALGWELLSVVLAVTTYRLLENPIRHSGYFIARRWVSLALGASLIISSFAVATVELHAHGSEALATPGLAALGTGVACPPPTQQELRLLDGTGPGMSDRVVARILLVGDSSACTMLPGLEAVGGPAGVRVEDASVIGCGVVSGEIAPSFTDGRDVNATTRTCQQRAIASEDRALHAGRPNVVVWASSWERTALVVGSGTHQTVVVPGSPQWYAVLLNRMETRVRTFTSIGATVVMLTQPPFAESGSPSSTTQSDVEFERLNALLTRFAAHTRHVRVVNLSAHVCPSGPPCPVIVDNIWVRPDDAHYGTEGSLWVARWLMPQLGINALTRPLSPLPLITWVNVKHGETVTADQPLAAITYFNLGITKVEFQATGPAMHVIVIGRAIYEDGVWGLHWNTSRVRTGLYVIRAIAYNTAGGRSVSKGITIRVKNATG
jgi:peptidoglycan/LPS O-acetylase OafA/YrhL